MGPSSTTPANQAIAVVRGRAERIAATYAKRFPSAADCLMVDFTSLTTYGVI